MKELKELKEIRIGDLTVDLKDNLVKTGVLPKNTSELERDVNIQGNVIVEGAIYARKLILDNGPVEFKSAVYAHNELFIKSDASDTINFNKAVASSGGIVALLVKGKCVFGADINAASIKLKNCFVAGSLFANEIQIENTVVLGGCFASKSLSVHNSLIGTFNAPEVSAGGINYLLYPTAFSVEPMASLPGTEFYNITLADLGSLFKNESEKPNTGKIRLDIETDVQKTVLTDESDTKTLLHSYSVASKVLVSDLLNMDDLENHFLIFSASLGSQILKTYSIQKADGSKSDDLTPANIANFFFMILDGRIQIMDLAGAVSFNDLRQRYL